MTAVTESTLLNSLRELLENSRQALQQSVNSAMVLTYWQVGQLTRTHYRTLIRLESEAVAKYSVLADGKQLFASKYLPYLPSEEDLRQELQRERLLIANQQDGNPAK